MGTFCHQSRRGSGRKVTETSRGDWQEKEKSRVPPPPFAALSHSRTALSATQLENTEGKAGGRVGIAPTLSTKPRHMKICCAGVLMVPSTDAKTSGWATGQLPTGLK